MSNLQTFIISGGFSAKQVNSPPAQPCLSGLQILTESPKSVINDSAIISPESVSSDSMEHCLVDDMHQRYHDQELDLTSDASSTGLCSKRTTEEPKLSRELLYDQQENDHDLPLKTLLRISSSRANDPMSGLDRKTSTQYQKKMPSTRRDGMVSEIGVKVQLLSNIMPIGTAGFDLPMESDKRDKSAVFDNPELHGFTTSGAATAIKTCGWSTQGSFSNITSELESNQSSNSLTGIFPTSDMLLPSEVFGQLSLFSSTDGDARWQKREIPGRMMNAPYCLDNETSRSSDWPPTNISYSSKVQDNNTSLATQTRTRNDYNLSTIKGGRYSPKNVPGKAIKPSTIMKPLPSKWDDAQKWLISSITNDAVAHRQADSAQFSSPTTKSVTAYPNEVRFKNNTSSTDHNLRLYGVAPIANKLDNPISHGCPRQINQAPAKQPISSNDYALKSGSSSEKSSRGYDQKQKYMLEARTTALANAQKLCIAHPLGNNDLSAAVKPSDINNIEATLVRSPQPGGTIMNLSTGQRASLVCINRDPAEMTESERLFSTVGEIRAPNHVISYDVHDMTDKYADRVVQTPDRSPRPTLKSEFLVQTPKLIRDSLPMKDVATEVSPISRYRDMGTQMTPHSSSRPSKCTTPISNISPARHNTPAKQAASSGPTGLGLLELQSCQLIAKLENRDLSLQSNFNALESSNTWSTREEEEEESFKSLTYVDLTEIKRSVVEARAAAWEEAEHTKRKSRYKREESKIQAWENHQKAKAEAEMRKLEVKLDKMRSHQTEKIMNKIAASHRHAENMRAAAQAEQAEQLAKSIERANQMRLSGHVPTPFCACFTCKT